MQQFLTSFNTDRLLSLALVFCAFLLFLWGPPLFDLDEGAFSAATSEMLRRRDFITTWLNGEPRFDKPILIYWLQALSVSLGGRDEFFFRLPSALAATAWGLSLYYFARQRLGEERAHAAVAFFCSCLTLIIIGRAATADALLNLLIALSMLDAWRYIESKRDVALYRAYLWIGLGLLTKGPVAAVIPFVTLSLFALLQRDFALWRAVAWRPLGWLIALAVAAPWYLLEYRAQGDAFIQGFFFEHNLGRFSDTMESHGGSVFYYLPILILMLMPFSAWLFGALVSLRQLRQDPLTTWCWIWFGFVLVFFSLSGTQLPHYILYGSTPLFLVMASRYDRLNSAWWIAVPAALLMLLWLALPWLASLALERESDPYMRAVLLGAEEHFSVIYFIGLTLALALIMLMPILTLGKLLKIQLLALIHILVLTLLVIPAVAAIKQQPVKNAAAFASSLEEPVVMWRHDMPSFSTYLDAVTPNRPPQRDELVFTREGKIPGEDLAVLFSEGGILIGRYLAEEQSN